MLHDHDTRYMLHGSWCRSTLLFVAWYCEVRLEPTLKTLVVPVFGASDYVAVFEWSPPGAMVHAHYILCRSVATR